MSVAAVVIRQELAPPVAFEIDTKPAWRWGLFVLRSPNPTISAIKTWMPLGKERKKKYLPPLARVLETAAWDLCIWLPGWFCLIEGFHGPRRPLLGSTVLAYIEEYKSENIDMI